MSRRRSTRLSRKPGRGRGLLASKPSRPPWLRARLLFEQLESRVPPGSLLVSPLGDAALLGGSQLAMPHWPDSPLADQTGDSTVTWFPQRLDEVSWTTVFDTRVAGQVDRAAADGQAAEGPVPRDIGSGRQSADDLTLLEDDPDQAPSIVSRRAPEPMWAANGSGAGGAGGGGMAPGGPAADGAFAPPASSGASTADPPVPDGSGPSGTSRSSSAGDVSTGEAEAEAGAGLLGEGTSAPLEATASGEWSFGESGSGGSVSGAAESGLSLGFGDGLDGWVADQSGGSSVGRGSVVPGDEFAGSAVLSEGDSFLVTLERSFTVPAAPAALEFTYIASFDTADPDSIRDAFEAALTGADGRPLAGTFASPRDAFFNVTEGLSPALGDRTTHSAASPGHTVRLDIGQLAPGTEARLTFRLVNNDRDTQDTENSQFDRASVASFLRIHFVAAIT
jgi:hypothetical protein